MENDIILNVENLSSGFTVEKQQVSIVKNVSFQVHRGKTLAIVGESGCGKSVTVHSVMQLLPKNGKIFGGTVTYYKDGKPYELTSLKKYGPEMRSIRGAEIGMVFQDPMASLNPVYTVGAQVAANLCQHFKMDKKEARKKVVEMFGKLGIPDPERRYDQYPHEFSGGMRQRVMIAIAMICNPQLIIADEPTTALDVTIQAQIMELMKKLQVEDGKSIILITHNMGLVAEMADEVAVMYMGRVVEYGTIEQIFRNPTHPYTAALLRSVPQLGMDRTKPLETIRGMTPNPRDLGKGCEFAGRCDFCTGACKKGLVPYKDIGDGHMVRCVKAEGVERK